MPKRLRQRRMHVVPGPIPIDERRSLGEEALHFGRWFAKSKYHLMGGFLRELMDPPRDPDLLRARYQRALQHGGRVNRGRALVTLLLALGILAAAASSIANVLDVDAPIGLLERAAAVSASLSVLLVAARLLFDRYLERIDVAATFLAIELAVSAGRSAAAAEREA